ncbi:energy transducer TonB [Paraburkholderia atlantica]|uniref:Protein TonB n=1 Tax=Paraburkholderia atlantica TaxID=2654982 RepID=A0A7W8Q364_PARAM|nr:energy transducer TonB [Paraburkholderia atlantica]MBB5422508.1 protein TonB [Paraburkholderia atlantica]
MRTAVACLIALGIWLLVLIALSSGLLKPNQAAPLPAPLDMRVVVLDEPAPPPPSPIEKPPPHAQTQPHTPPHHAIQQAVSKTATLSAPAVPAPMAAREQHETQQKQAAQPAATGSPQTSSEHTAAPSAAAPSTATARSISQPLPSLPDDLREQAYQTVATARFTIHADGSVDVELIQATPNPRLNQLLLDTLRRWRFFPALRDGRPVESTQDIRVHFNVS